MGKQKSRIDLVRLKEELTEMNRSNPIYKVVKEVLSVRGWWKNHSRGNPKLGWANRKIKAKEK